MMKKTDVLRDNRGDLSGAAKLALIHWIECNDQADGTFQKEVFEWFTRAEA